MIYPIDPTGISPSNRVIDETQVISPPGRVTDASFFVPRVTPFFREGLVIKQGTRTLIENVDYQLIFRSVALSEHFERELFGGVMFTDRNYAGTLKISYQVLGGDFQNNEYELLERLARVSGAVRWVTYDQIIGTPSGFPPAYHQHDMEKDLVNMGDVVDAVEKIAVELGKAPASLDEVNERMNAHLTQAHAHTKSQIGLGQIENLPVASDAEVKAGVRKYVTADSLKKQLPDLVKENMPPIVIPPPTDLPAQEHQPTIDKINTLRQDITNVKNALNSNSSADTTWRAEHVKITGDPHPQYVTAQDISGQLSGFIDRLDTLEQKVNVPPPGAGGPLGGIKAFWTFPTPPQSGSTAYQVSGGQPGLPAGPLRAKDPIFSAYDLYSSVTITNSRVDKIRIANFGGGGLLVGEYMWILRWVEFKTSFDLDLTKLTCLTQHGQPLTVTQKSDGTYRVDLLDNPIGRLNQEMTPLMFTLR